MASFSNSSKTYAIDKLSRCATMVLLVCCYLYRKCSKVNNVNVEAKKQGRVGVVPVSLLRCQTTMLGCGGSLWTSPIRWRSRTTTPRLWCALKWTVTPKRGGGELCNLKTSTLSLWPLFLSLAKPYAIDKLSKCATMVLLVCCYLYWNILNFPRRENPQNEL